jgi:hypothetical protein
MADIRHSTNVVALPTAAKRPVRQSQGTDFDVVVAGLPKLPGPAPMLPEMPDLAGFVAVMTLAALPEAYRENAIRIAVALDQISSSATSKAAIEKMKETQQLMKLFAAVAARAS